MIIKHLTSGGELSKEQCAVLLRGLEKMEKVLLPACKKISDISKKHQATIASEDKQPTEEEENEIVGMYQDGVNALLNCGALFVETAVDVAKEPFSIRSQIPTSVYIGVIFGVGVLVGILL